MKVIPLDKMQKKERRKRNAAKRNNWNGINPITRAPEPSYAYNRNKQKREDRKNEYDSYD